MIPAIYRWIQPEHRLQVRASLDLAKATIVRLSIAPSSSWASRHLKLVELCFQYSFLNGRATEGPLTSDHARALDQLRPLFEGDPPGGRRRHRRHPTYLPALVKTPGSEGHAILLNFSSGGLLLATRQAASEGDLVQVKMGTPGKVEYLFSCLVIRTHHGPSLTGLACRFVGPPVELRSHSN